MKAIKKLEYITRELSGPQKRIHFDEFHSGPSPVNNLVIAHFFQDHVPIDRLIKAIEQTLISHPILRTRLKQGDSTAVQYLTPFENISTQQYLQFKSLEDFEKWAEKIAREKIPYWNSPLVHFIPFEVNNELKGFLVRSHHIISDAWTHQLISQEVKDFLESDKLLPQRKKKGSYIQFLNTESDYLQSERYGADEKFWTQSLFPLPESTGLIKRQHPESYESERCAYDLPEDLSELIDAHCEKQGISHSTFFLMVLSALLYLRSGMEEFIVGMLTHNRLGKAEKRTAGMFVSTIALKIRMDGSASIEENQKNLNLLTMKGMRHQRFPLERLLNSKNREGTDVFKRIEILYTYENVELPFSYKTVFCGADSFPLVFRPSRRTGQSFKIEIDYRKDCIKEQEVQSLLRQYRTVLESILKDNPASLEQTQWISSRSQNQVLNQFNSPIILPEPDSPKLIHQLLERQTEKTPQAVALTFEDREMTYDELNRKANRIARKLLEKYGPGEKPIAFIANRSLELPLFLYAVLKAGFAYIPLDKNHPEERNRIILQQARPELVLTNIPCVLSIYEETEHFDDWLNSEASDENLYHPIEPDRLAYMIFTSGTTGEPKGVMLEHKAVINRLLWMNEFYELDEKDCFIQKTPYTFDVSVPELFGWPQGGGRLHILSPGEEKDPSALSKAINSRKATIVHFVPSMLDLFLSYIKTNHMKKDLESLKILVCSGETLKGDTANRLKTFLDDQKIRLLNLYGPTEAAVEVTAYECPKKYQPMVPIGKPIKNCQLLILSSKGEILPPGIQGELVIAGEQLARGYFQSSELTEKAFAFHPEAAGQRIYKTGDLASWTEEGLILFHGRMDNQVKIRGNRIETEEIESALVSYIANMQCAVTVQKDKSGHNVLACHYVTPTLVSPEELKSHLAEKVPPYMIPQLWTSRESLPLTSSGKVDRKALPPIEISSKIAVKKESGFSIESLIRTEWEKVLSKEAFTNDEEFFQLGGDSFGLITIFASLEKKFDLNLQELFDYSTINSLADYILNNKTINLTEKKSDLKIWDQVSRIGKERKRLRDYEEQQFRLYYSTIPHMRDFENILITGATGYFGIHLVHRILEQSDSSLVLMLRCPSPEEGQMKFSDRWKHYFHEEPTPEQLQRLKFIPGDLNEPDLGLDERNWRFLQEEIDTIVHAGANVKHYGHYDEFVGTNIRGTEKLMELMKAGRQKEFHYISTISIHLLRKDCGFGYFLESDFPEEPHLSNNYLESKWEAERLLRSSGMNVRYYRLGNLVGHSQKRKHQINSQENAFLQSLNTFKKIGAMPEIEEEFVDLTFVDQAAEAVWLLMGTRSPLRCFHVLNPHRKSLTQMAEAMELSSLEIGDFMEKVDKEAEIFTFAPYLKYPELLLSYPKCDQTDVLLKKGGFQWKKPVAGDLIFN